MQKTKSGFTLVEIIFVLVIGAVLTSVTLTSFASPLRQLSARGARSVFATYHARARASAVETGTAAALFVDASGDSLILMRNGVLVESINLREEFNANIVMDSTRLLICMGPRGYTLSACNSFETTQTINFVVGTDTSSVDLLPLGQLIY